MVKNELLHISCGGFPRMIRTHVAVARNSSRGGGRGLEVVAELTCTEVIIYLKGFRCAAARVLPRKCSGSSRSWFCFREKESKRAVTRCIFNFRATRGLGQITALTSVCLGPCVSWNCTGSNLQFLCVFVKWINGGSIKCRFRSEWKWGVSKIIVSSKFIFKNFIIYFHSNRISQLQLTLWENIIKCEQI